MSLLYKPKNIEDVHKLLIDIDRRVSNIDGSKGKSLSHDKLSDTEDHQTFLKTDGSRACQSDLDIGGNQLINATNPILNVNANKGHVVIDPQTNTLSVNQSLVNGGLTTDSIKEGTHNLYFTDARVEAVGDPRYAPIDKGVTNGDSHDHYGGDGAQIDHIHLANIGVNTHAQIDAALAGMTSSSIQATVDFGASETEEAMITVSASSVRSGSKIICSVFAGITADHDAEDAVLEGLHAYASNIIDGVSFDIYCSCNDTTWGKYLVNAIY